MGSRKFSPSDDERLVSCVKAFPVLFNHERFFIIKNPDIIRENWRAVAAEVGRDEEACKKRWRDIRDHFFKVKRKQRANKDKRWTTRWPLYKSLSFLADAKRKKRHPNEDDYSDQEFADRNIIDIYEPETTFKVEDDSRSQMECMVSPKQEADTSYRAPSESGSIHFLEDPQPSWDPPTLLEAFSYNRRLEGEDDIDVFMRSVAMTVKRLTPKVRAEAKLKILSVVTELEFPKETESKSEEEYN